MITFHDESFSLLTLDEAAAELELSRTRVRQLARDGELVTVYHGGERMVSGDEVARFARDYTPPTRPHAPATGVLRHFVPPPRPAA